MMVAIVVLPPLRTSLQSARMQRHSAASGHPAGEQEAGRGTGGGGTEN